MSLWMKNDLAGRNAADALSARRMTTEQALQDLVRSSRPDDPTPKPIRSLVLAAVDQALEEHYGDEASAKCYQSSFGIAHLLARYGVPAELWSGAVCVPERLSPDGRELSWGGFWGDDFHVWIRTSRRELVDLSITRLHRRPLVRDRPGPQVPAIWWQNTLWPRSIVYVPNAIVPPREFPPQFEADLQSFAALCEFHERKIRRSNRINRLRFGPVITCVKDLERLRTERNPWAEAYDFFETHKIPFPPELVSCHSPALAARLPLLTKDQNTR